MINLKFTLRATLPDVPDDAPVAERAAITARIVADLRAAAAQIEREGLTGLWQNVAPMPGMVRDDGIFDDDGYCRIAYAIKRNNPNNTADQHGPECPAATDTQKV